MAMRRTSTSGGRRSPTSRRTAYSLLEIVLASAICATALVPALTMVRDSVTLADNIDARHRLLLYGVSKLEEQAAVVAATWAQGTIIGNFADDGHAELGYIVTRSDAPSDGGIEQRLMNVTVTTYRDDNGNALLDEGELHLILRTKISKLASYENKAGN